MVLVKGLDRMDGTKLAGMTDERWSRHSEEIKAEWEKAGGAVAIGFEDFCLEYHSGKRTTAALREHIQEKRSNIGFFANDKDNNKSGDWSSLVGQSGEEAVAKIKNENSDLENVLIVPHGSMVTMDYRTDRVRVFVDEQGKVSKTPKRG